MVAPAKQLSQVLRLPARVPLHLSRIELSLVYRRAALRDRVPSERASEMVHVAEPLTELLRAGFLCRPGGPDPAALVTVEQTAASRVRFVYAGRGVHANLLVVLFRLIYAYHQTPPGTFDRVAAQVGEHEAREFFYEFEFDRLVAAITLDQLVGRPGAAQVAAPKGTRALTKDMPLPASGPLEGAPVIDAELLRVTPGMDVPDDALEDAWLSCSQVPLFVPPGYDAEFEPGDEWFDASPTKRVLRIAELSIEQPFLFELLDLLSGRRIERLRVQMR